MFNSCKELVLEEEEEEALLANFLLIIFTRWAVDLLLEDEEGFSKFVAKLEAHLFPYITLYSLYIS